MIKIARHKISGVGYQKRRELPNQVADRTGPNTRLANVKIRPFDPEVARANSARFSGGRFLVAKTEPAS